MPVNWLCETGKIKILQFIPPPLLAKQGIFQVTVYSAEIFLLLFLVKGSDFNVDAVDWAKYQSWN